MPLKGRMWDACQCCVVDSVISGWKSREPAERNSHLCLGFCGGRNQLLENGSVGGGFSITAILHLQNYPTLLRTQGREKSRVIGELQAFLFSFVLKCFAKVYLLLSVYLRGRKQEILVPHGYNSQN